MSSEWVTTTLGDFVQLQRGHDLTASEQQPGPFPVMGSAGPNGCHNVAKALGPGVVVGRSGASMGKVHYSEKDFWPHNTCLYVTDFLGNNPRFTYYLLGSLDLAGYNSGSAQPSLNRNYIYGIPIRVPPRIEQDTIAKTLQALDDRIALLRETNATLEAIAQALFKSWFVDFDPVHAKAPRPPLPPGEGLGVRERSCTYKAIRQISEQDLPHPGPLPRGEGAGLPEPLAALFPDSFDESPLGRVPRGWKLLPLEEAYEINPTRKLKKGEMAPYLDMASVTTSGHTVAGAIEREMGSGTKFINGDTLLARITPCLENGKTAFVDFLEEGKTGWGSTEFVVLRPKAPLPPYHGYLLSRHPAFREHAIQSMSGTSGRQRVQNDVLGRYPVVVPSEAVAAAFGEVVGGIQKKIAANHLQSQTLATLRDTLLPRLISGQLRLPEAEEAIATEMN